MATGRPASTLATADQTVVSVGPYIFQSEPQRVRIGSASSAVQASPPQRIFSPGAPVQPASRSMRNVLGVACKTVTPQRVISSPSAPPSRVASVLAITMEAPDTNGRNI